MRNKLKIFSGCLLLVLFTNSVLSQCLMEDMIVVEGNWPVIPSYTLNKPAGISGSILGYCPQFFNSEFGASYVLFFSDQGGNGMDGYPSIRGGGSRYNNAWHPGDFELVGMPVQIRDIDSTMYFELITTQENAIDDDDKWMASINFIFDLFGTKESLPVTADRDFDIVVKAQSFQFIDDLSDLTTPINNRYWYFARHPDGSLKPFEVDVDGIIYTYAVRYKFFDGAGDKDNKVHVKFIPYGPSGTPSSMRINVKEVIKTSREYIQYTSMPEEQRILSLEKIARDDTWLKGINAGYEVYKGESILKIDRFKIYPNDTQTMFKESPDSIINALVYPIPFKEQLKWKGLSVEKVQLKSIDGSNLPIIRRGNSIEIRDLPKGFYLLQLKLKNGKNLVKKVIKH